MSKKIIGVSPRRIHTNYLENHLIDKKKFKRTYKN
jgi:hypothetical protein